MSTALLYALVLLFIYLARYVLIAFLLALLFAYLVEPAVGWFQRALRLPRVWSVALLYVLMTLVLATFFLTVGPGLAHQAVKLGRDLPSLSEQLTSGKLVAKLGGVRGWSAETQAEITHVLAEHRGDILRLEQELASYAATGIKDLWWIILIPIISVFYLLSGGELGRAIIDLAVLRRRRQFLDDLMGDLHYVWAHYIRAQLILMLIAIAVYLVFLTLMGVPDALALGFGAGLLEFIPTLGPFIAAAMILAVAFVLGYQHWLFLILFLAAWRVEQDYVNAPHIMGSHVQLHPFLVIFAVLTGAELAGVLGVFLSVPVAASLRVLWIRWRAYGAARQLAEPEVSSSPKRSG